MNAPSIETAIEAARHEAHANLDRSFDALRDRYAAQVSVTAGTAYKDPTEQDCRDPRNKNGYNLTTEGKEILFRLLDGGAGYNSASRKLAITASAVKNRKKEWLASGGVNRTKIFIPYMDGTQ